MSAWLLISYSSGANITWEENMFNYYIKTPQRNERRIGQLGQWNFRGICECFLNRWLVWIESVHFVSLSNNMNGIYGCFLYCFFVWMESLHVFLIVCLNEWNLWIYFIICLHEWNMWIFLLYAYIYEVFKCFLRSLFIWMESLNVFFNF